MTATLVRMARCIGWAVLAGSVGVVIVTTIWQAGHGPITGQSAWPTPRLWRFFLTSLGMGGAATAMALLLAIPAAMALVTAARPWQRAAMAALVVMPLVTMPSAFAYAWMLLATSRIHWIASAMQAIGWNSPGAPVWESAWVLATWLWPIPCLFMVTAFRHAGAGAYQLAALDSSPVRAFLRGALPVMRGPLVASLAIVFILAVTDSTIPPIMTATQVWSGEMLAQASVASKYDRPAAYIFWLAWPMMAVVAAAALAALPGLKRMSRWADDPTDLGRTVTTSKCVWWIAASIAAVITVVPMTVFCVELSTGRTTAGQAIATVARTLSRAGTSSLIVSVCTAVAAGCAAMTAMNARRHGEDQSWLGMIAFALLATTAILPPELTGTALVSFFSKLSKPTDWWSVYDRTPWVWIAAMISRFGFLPACVVAVMSRRISHDLNAIATTDGATTMQRLVHVRLPAVWGGLAAACMIVACLTMSEVAISVLTQPPGFFGGSLAVAVDAQMHFGRQNETVAGALMLMIPAMATAAIFAWMWGRASRQTTKS